MNEGYDPIYGARPLKRTIQRRILDPLAFKVLDGAFKDGDLILVDAKNGDIIFRRAQENGEQLLKEAVAAGEGQPK